MANTVQGVNWALERACRLRGGEGWALPDVTRRQLADVSTYARAVPHGLVVDDVCVIGYTFGSDSAGATVSLPCSGFRVSLALAPFGGEAAVRAACSACEANVAPDDRPVLANCHGFLVAWPDSEELEAALQVAIRLRGLEERIARLFPRTTPLWYGLWIESPLRRPHCEVLLELLEGLADLGGTQDNDPRHFLAALRAAVTWELPLHVAVPPPGHADLGWYTVFPHCPRCKAHAPLEQWQESYPEEPIPCPVCGQRYSPAATQRSEQMDDALWEESDLKNVLGADNVQAFRRRFLRRQGHSPEQIEDVLDRHNNGPLRRRIADLRRRQDTARRRLPAPVPPPDSPPAVLTLEVGPDVPLRLRLLPAGEVLMGTAGGPEEAGSEGPQHLVRIGRPFYLGEFPVTQAQFEAVMGINPSRYRGDSDRPVERVSWFAAQEFCLRLSRQVGRWVRLPTEAEWEYACRAGTTTKYHWGDEVTKEQVNCKPTGAPLVALVTGPEVDAPAVETNVQGLYPPNAWGLYDLHGNVREWCEDEWHDRYDGAPGDGSAWVTPGDEDPFRPVRGGSCWYFAAACTSAWRQALRADADDEADDPPEEDSLLGDLLRGPPVGFRVVVEAD